MATGDSDSNSRTLAAVLYLLGKLQRVLAKISSSPNGQERKRLRKQPRGRDSHEIRYPNERIMINMVQSCEKLLRPQTPAKMATHNKKNPGLLPGQEIQPLTLIRHAQQFPDNNSDRHGMETMDEMKVDQERQIRRRTMAKTPVRYIGQLEQASSQMDNAQLFAEQYQNILPPRTPTPGTQQRLRKVRCQPSLKDLVKDQAKSSPPSSPRSECDTLIGSESPSSTYDYDQEDQLFHTKGLSSTIQLVDRDSGISVAEIYEDDIDDKASADYLIDEISTSLLSHEQSEFLSHASLGQIMLTIEAYQSIQEEFYQKLQESRAVDVSEEQVNATKQLLENWLDVLYAAYDEFEEKRRDSGFGDEDWPLSNSARFGQYSYVEPIQE